MTAFWTSVLLLLFVLDGVANAGTIYPVGPSQSFATIGAALSGRTLGPGDEVWIYGRPSPYFEKFVINAIGTKDAPVVIKGIPVNGVLPIIDGTSAVTAPTQDYWGELRGLIKVGAASIPAIPDNTVASFIRIENLQLQNARPGISFTDDKGSTTSYVSNAACIYIEQGKNIELVNNTITGCGNGIFITPGVEEVLIESNYIYGNGISGSILEHNTYTEALGITYRFNRFGPLCSGCLGNNLKDRSGGLTVAYNVIQGGNRQLDLVDSTSSTIVNSPRYRATYVYGNILVEAEGTDNRQIIHYGGDSGQQSNYRGGTLYLYHNTIVSTRVGRTTLIRLSSEGETCDARNNIIFVSAAGSELELLSENRGTLILRNSWMKVGYALSFTQLGVGNVTVTNQITGTNPGFADPNFATSLDVRISASLLPSASLSSGVPSVSQEYVLHTKSRPRTGTDIGAYGFGNAATVPTVPSPNPPTAPMAQPMAVPAMPQVVAAPNSFPVAPISSPSAPSSASSPTSNSRCRWRLLCWLALLIRGRN